jgi:hypothetical protein
VEEGGSVFMEKMSMRSMILLITAVALLPAGLLAQDRGMGAERRVQAVMDAAARAELPLSLLQSKIDEGRAKGVSLERIATALEARLEGLLRAQAVLAGGEVHAPSVGDIAVTADALEAGVSEVALLQIQSTSPGDRRVVATAVLAALVQLGHVPEHALAQVRTALSRGPGALANLRSETARQMRARGIRMPGRSGGHPGNGAG